MGYFQVTSYLQQLSALFPPALLWKCKLVVSWMLIYHELSLCNKSRCISNCFERWVVVWCCLLRDWLWGEVWLWLQGFPFALLHLYCKLCTIFRCICFCTALTSINGDWELHAFILSSSLSTAIYESLCWWGKCWVVKPFLQITSFTRDRITTWVFFLQCFWLMHQKRTIFSSFLLVLTALSLLVNSWACFPFSCSA